ncbi:MAG: hypothetical protein HFG57_08860 [Lachnospiraceae bacterium]|nr:hypothetical protein [Lachnospiraceae bacterium]
MFYESAFYETKTLCEDRTGAVRNHVAEATRRRRRILRSGILFMSVGILLMLEKRKKQ